MKASCDGRGKALCEGEGGVAAGGWRFQKSVGLENSMDRGAWQATVHRVAKTQT